MSGIPALDHRRVLHALPYPVLIHTLDTIVYANLEACRILDAGTPDALVGLPVSSLSHADTRVVGAERRRLVIEKGAVVTAHLKLLTLEGRVCKATALANPIRVGDQDYICVAAAIDAYLDEVEPRPVSERVPVTASEQLFEAALDALALPVFVYDDVVILYANTAAERLFKAEEGLAGRSIADMGHPDGIEASAQRTRLILDTGRSITGAPVKLTALDGSPLQAHANVSWVDLGERRAVIGVLLP